MSLLDYPWEAFWYSLEATEARNAEVHDRSDERLDVVMMGLFEPILVLSVMAVITYRCRYPRKGMGSAKS